MKQQTILILFCSIFILLSIAWTFYQIRKAKKQVKSMTIILGDIKKGNGNRRIIITENQLTAPLAYEINEIVSNYEHQLTNLKQNEESNKQLMTSLSHDIRTPLTTLIGYLDAIQKNVVNGKEKDNYLKIVQQKAYDLKNYIDTLFDWFKLNSDEFELELTSAELGELTRKILIDWIPLLEEKQMAFNVDIPEYPIFIKVDIESYTRILHNLMQNILIHSHADRINLVLSVNQSQAIVSLSDNGIGIAEKELTAIFDRLYKCDTSRGKKGSGLGLSIVKQLTEKMAGTITVVSPLNCGTKFVLYFPLNRPDNSS